MKINSVFVATVPLLSLILLEKDFLSREINEICPLMCDKKTFIFMDYNQEIAGEKRIKIFQSDGKKGQKSKLLRLAEYRAQKSNWKLCGPYLSERAWGTVREDYNGTGSAWEYFPHDHTLMLKSFTLI
jgi:hypothetical protein